MLGILTPSATALLHNTSTILIGMHSMTNLPPEKNYYLADPELTDITAL